MDGHERSSAKMSCIVYSLTVSKVMACLVFEEPWPFAIVDLGSQFLSVQLKSFNDMVQHYHG